MIHAIVTIQDYFKRENIVIDEFFKYINNKVLLVYISSSIWKILLSCLM